MKNLLLHGRVLTSLAVCVMSFASAPALTQPPATPTIEDYTRAEKFMPYNTAAMIVGATGHPTWLEDGRVWYRRTTGTGSEFIAVDPVRGTRGPAFDHAWLAGALSTALERKIEPGRLPFATFELPGDGSVSFDVDSQHWSCSPQRNSCVRAGSRDINGSLSPDGRRMAFIRNYNLWVRDLASGAESALTTDGVRDFGYATDNPGWNHTDRAVVLWSPDSQRIATSSRISAA